MKSLEEKLKSFKETELASLEEALGIAHTDDEPEEEKIEVIDLPAEDTEEAETEVDEEDEVVYKGRSRREVQEQFAALKDDIKESAQRVRKVRDADEIVTHLKDLQESLDNLVDMKKETLLEAKEDTFEHRRRANELSSQHVSGGSSTRIREEEQNVNELLDRLRKQIKETTTVIRDARE